MEITLKRTIYMENPKNSLAKSHGEGLASISHTFRISLIEKLRQTREIGPTNGRSSISGLGGTRSG